MFKQTHSTFELSVIVVKKHVCEKYVRLKLHRHI